jgi:hypothetical protein
MKSLFIVLLIVLINSTLVKPCTTAVISGKATNDGRPLLMKHRDTDDLNNIIKYFNDGKYSYVGLVDASDSLYENVWIGFNEKGFAIMNSASYNLKDKSDTTDLADLEGALMKHALMNCASIEEFEEYLNSADKPLSVEANFGVIDALGNAAYFETNNFSYKKFDVNDESTAPNGYLIRTNYSFSGYEAESSNGISFNYLLKNVPRCLKHGLTKEDLRNQLPENDDVQVFKSFQDYIPRYYTSASVIVQGVLPTELPNLTTMWSIVGFPLSSVAIPVWLVEENDMPKLLTPNENGLAPICSASLKLKKEMFPIIRGSGDKYINLSKVMNKENTGITQKLQNVEKTIIEKGNSVQNELRNGKYDKSKIIEFNNWVDIYITEQYNQLFGLNLF